MAGSSFGIRSTFGEWAGLKHVLNDLALIERGQRVVYWTGYLCGDCDRTGQRGRNAREVRDAAQRLYEQGRAELVQERMSQGGCRYIAVGVATEERKFPMAAVKGDYEL